jgi:hypothetical protein
MSPTSERPRQAGIRVDLGSDILVDKKTKEKITNIQYDEYNIPYLEVLINKQGEEEQGQGLDGYGYRANKTCSLIAESCKPQSSLNSSHADSIEHVIFEEARVFVASKFRFGLENVPVAIRVRVNCPFVMLTATDTRKVVFVGIWVLERCYYSRINRKTVQGYAMQQ